MTPMPPTPGAVAPTQPPAQPTAPIDAQEVASETGYPLAKVQQDIAQSGATTKEQLYPQFYGGQGIQPDAAAIGAGYGDDESSEASPDNEMAEGDQSMQPPVAGASPEDMNEAPQRIEARRAMAGHRPAARPARHQPPAMSQEEALGMGASHRQPFNVHDRARKMKARPY